MKSICLTAAARMLHGAPFLFVLFLAGCGGSTFEPADSTLAKESLLAALDGWKQGQTPEDLKAGSPAIIVGDVAWESGEKLESFDLLEPVTDDGANLHYPVKRVLKGSQGTRTELVTYIVGTHPVITIFPEQ